MKRYIKLSLLLLLIPLFVKNVYAEELIDSKIRIETNEILEIKNEELKDKEELDEDTLEDSKSYDDIKTGASKENEITKELIIDSIDKIYELDVEETDNLSYNEKSKAKEVLMNIINNNLKEKDYNLEQLGYKYDVIWNYYENKNVSSYTFILYDKENNELSRKELDVKYNNSEELNEEDNNKIEKFLENKDLTLTKEYSLEEILSNIKENKSLYLDIKEHLANIFFGSDINFFILTNNKNLEQNLSGSITEQVILSINGIIYKTIYVENKYITIIEVPIEEDQVSYIESYIEDKLNEHGYKNIEEIRFTPETNCVFVKDDKEEKSLGKVKIEKIVNDYKYMSGANSTIYNTDHLELEVNGDRNEFKRIEINSVEVNPIYYSISSDNTKITIKNEFIKALNNGKYTIDVIFKSGRAKTTFTITSKQSTPPVVQRPVTNVQTRPYYPSHTVVNNNQNTVDDQISEVDENEEKETDLENNKEEKENDLEAGQEIDLDNIFEVDKDNDTDADSKNSDKKEEKKISFIKLLKSRYVPIIIVVITVLIGGITAYVFFKTKEESII